MVKQRRKKMMKLTALLTHSDILGYSEEEDKIVIFLKSRASRKTIQVLKQLEEESDKNIEVHVLSDKIKIF